MYSSALDLYRTRNKKKSENSVFITKAVQLLQKKKKKESGFFWPVKVFAIAFCWYGAG